MSPCGRFLAVGGTDLWVHDLADEKSGKLVTDYVAYTVAFAPDGTEFAAPAFNPRQWAVPSWEVIRAGDASSGCPNQFRNGNEFRTGAIAYTPNGSSIAMCFAVRTHSSAPYSSSRLRFFDRATGAETADLLSTFGHAYPTQIAFSPDGSVIAGNFGPVLGVTSVADGKEVARIKTGTKHITGLAFTPDGSKLVTVSNDARVRVFDARTWKETAGYEWKVGKLRCVAVAPDGLRMAAGSGTGKIVVWDADA
jgi:WD40 repeat protein